PDRAGAAPRRGRARRPQRRRERPGGVSRRGRLPPLDSGGGGPDPSAQRVRYRLHALPAGGEPGHLAGDLRVPDLRRAPPRARGGERQHVRRRIGDRRGGAHGPPPPAGPPGDLAGACTPSALPGYGGDLPARARRPRGARGARRGRRPHRPVGAARGPHLRRDRATSNICTNQALCALAVTVYLSLLGRHGLASLALANYRAAHLAAARLEAAAVALRFPAPFFNEFVVRAPAAAS